ncbi:hypothetical protein [Ferrovum sp.]|uniref:hypothetical protein n=1 Tax=Ferrovum sp. TaxID=2609467 RepID=UPI002635463F|nr:hypothetical protein [Ferrovum sp.]
MENEKMEPELLDLEKIETGAMIADLLFIDLFRDDVYNRFQPDFLESLADELRRAESRLRLATGLGMAKQMRGETGEGVEQYAFIRGT